MFHYHRGEVLFRRLRGEVLFRRLRERVLVEHLYSQSDLGLERSRYLLQNDCWLLLYHQQDCWFHRRHHPRFPALRRLDHHFRYLKNNESTSRECIEYRLGLLD